MLTLKRISSRCVAKCQKNVCVTLSRNQKSAAQKLVLKDHRSHPIGAISKKLPKPPFLKNLFIGNFDLEFMYYPEAAETDRYLALQHILPQVKEFFSNEVDSSKIDKEGYIPEDVISNLKSLGLFGNTIPGEFGGLGHSCSEYARIFEEIAVHPSIFLMLMVHQSFGARALLQHGTQDQKVRYLTKLTSGEWIAGFCAAESEVGMDYSGMTSRAELNDDGTHWTLNGSKVWVVNGTLAEFFIVAMPTETVKARAKLNNLLTLFIVEKNYPGVRVQPRENTCGAKGVSICEVQFEDVVVPKNNVLGEVGHGFDVCSSILNNDSFMYGSMAAGFLRNLMNKTVNHVIQYQQFQRDLIDINSVKEIVSDIAMKIYAVESMTYMTTGIMDSYEQPDITLESVVTKLFAIQTIQDCVQLCSELLGTTKTLENLPFEQMIRDSQVPPLFNVSVDFSDVYVAAVGLNFAGPHLQTYVSKMRNPLTFPATAFKLFIETQRNLKNDPKLSLQLYEYAHPSLKEVCNLLERAVLRFKFCALIALTNDGMKIMDNYINLKRLSEMAMLCYAMTAVISRASRSYCCGTQNCDHEMVLAESFTRVTYDRFDRIVNEVFTGPFVQIDTNREKISDLVFKQKGYAAEHPINRNII